MKLKLEIGKLDRFKKLNWLEQACYGGRLNNALGKFGNRVERTDIILKDDQIKILSKMKEQKNTIRYSYL